jgi:hypothetical protein
VLVLFVYWNWLLIFYNSLPYADYFRLVTNNTIFYILWLTHIPGYCNWIRIRICISFLFDYLRVIFGASSSCCIRSVFVCISSITVIVFCCIRSVFVCISSITVIVFCWVYRSLLNIILVFIWHLHRCRWLVESGLLLLILWHE